MSFISNLEIDGNSYKVLHCNFNFYQPKGTNSKPSGKPQGGELIVTLEIDRTATDFFLWMINPTLTKSGTLTFYKRDAMSRLMTFDFSNGFCTNLSGMYDANDNQPLRISVTITSENLSVNGEVDYVNNWNGASS